MSIKDYETIIQSLEDIKDNYYPEAEIYKMAEEIKTKIIESQIPF